MDGGKGTGFAPAGEARVRLRFHQYVIGVRQWPEGNDEGLGERYGRRIKGNTGEAQGEVGSLATQNTTRWRIYGRGRRVLREVGGARCAGPSVFVQEMP